MAFRIYYTDGNQRIFAAPTMIELLGYLLAEDQPEMIYKISRAPEYDD